MITTDERIADLKAFSYSPDVEGVPNPDVEWLVAELEKARGALKAIELEADGHYRSRASRPDSYWLLARCREGLR